VTEQSEAIARLLKAGAPVATVAYATGLTIEEVKALNPERVVNTRTKPLNAQDVAEIKACLSRYSQQSIAEVYGIHRAVVSNISRGVNWKHVERSEELPEKEGLRVKHLNWQDWLDVEILKDRGYSNREITGILSLEQGVLRNG